MNPRKVNKDSPAHHRSPLNSRADNKMAWFATWLHKGGKIFLVLSTFDSCCTEYGANSHLQGSREKCREAPPPPEKPVVKFILFCSLGQERTATLEIFPCQTVPASSGYSANRLLESHLSMKANLNVSLIPFSRYSANVQSSLSHDPRV